MNNRNERSETTLCVLYKVEEDSEPLMMSPQKARNGAWVSVLVVCLISAMVVLGGGGSFFMEKNGLDLTMNTDPRQGTVPELNTKLVSSKSSRRLQDSTGDCQMQLYTLTDIAQSADCWVNLYGVVYDLTSFLDRHPGGSIIRSLCGTDGTTPFDNEHSVGLLRKKGFSSSIIGRLGESSGVQSVPCNEVDSVAVADSAGGSGSSSAQHGGSPLSTMISFILVSMIIVGW
jgi:Cytochrome b5-like Heme/Steroid binding domain